MTISTSVRFHLLALALIAAGLAARINLELLSDDSAWLIYCAKRILAGDVLVRDLFEINPPLIIYLHIPVALLAEALGISPHTAFYTTVSALVLACYLLSHRRLEVEASSAAGNGLLKVFFAYLIAVQPAGDFGQREHLLVLLATPFLLLTAGKLDGADAGAREMIPFSLLAAVGFALKPHFLAALAALLAFAVLARGRRGLFMVKDCLPILAFAAAYGVLVVLFHPQYLAEVLPWALKYHAAGGDFERIGTVLALSPVLLAALALAPIRWPAFVSFASMRERLLFAASTLFLLVFVAQGKGVPYQFVPAMTWGYLLLGLVAVRLFFSAHAAKAAVAAMVAAPLIAMWPIGMFSAWPSLAGFRNLELTAFLSDNFSGRPALIMTTRWSATFPLALYAGVVWSSRYPSLWLLGPILKAGDDEDLNAFTGAVAEDLARHGPEVVLVDRRGVAAAALLDVLGRDPRFAAAWSAYRNVCRGERYLVFARRDDPAFPPCPDI